MRKILVLSGAALLLAATYVWAQDQGLRLGPEREDATSEEIVEELRSIHEQLGSLLDRLGASAAETAGLDELEQRVTALERQVRGQAVGTARAELQNLRGELEEDGDLEGVTGEVERLRSELMRAFDGAGDGDIDWEATGRELTTTFDALIEQLGGEAEPGQAFEEALGELDTISETVRTGGAERAEEEEAEAATAEAQEATEEPFEAQVEGARIYATNCAACHQGDGRGVEGVYPPLAGNPFVTGEPEPVIDVVLHGRGGMPSFDSLSDREIAAVISHERNAWDNEASEISPEMVSPVREGERLEGLGDPTTRPGAAD